MVIRFDSYRGITVDQLLHRGIIDTSVKASHKTMFFDYKYFPSMERLINNDSTLTQLWDSITIRNHEFGGDMLFETSVPSTATLYKVPENIYK
jgi:hypothetical protein